MTAGFDRVEMPAIGDDLPRRLTRAEFDALPLSERVRAILSKKMRFYRDGKEVPVREALENR